MFQSKTMNASCAPRPGSAGGRVRAIVQHCEAVASFVPKPCLYCGDLIIYVEGQKVGYIKSKKFCNLSCSSKYYQARKITPPRKEIYCKRCSGAIKNYKSRTRRYCDDCLRLVRSLNSKTNNGFAVKAKADAGFFREVRRKQLEHEERQAQELRDDGYQVFSPTVVCDRVAVKGSDVFFVEFKKHGQELRPAQKLISDLVPDRYIVRYS